jgi:photosystem II stability/assembly factor-like uncharacterized protein
LSISNNVIDGNTHHPDYAKATGRINQLAASASGAIYAGSDGGGVWKSTDAGGSWSPLTDNIPAPKVTALQVDPASNQIVFAGLNTGERDIGAGLYRSQNAGASWARVGIATFGSQFISAIRVDPSNHNYVYAALSGGGTMGVAVSTNNGQTWPQSQVSLANEPVFDLAISGNGTVYAAVPGKGVYRSTNHGASWQLLKAFTPSDTLKIAIAPSNNQVLYVEQANKGYTTGIFRSLNGGATWTNICQPSALLCQPGNNQDGSHQVYDYIAVDNSNPGIVFVGLVDLWETTNGTSGSPTWTDALERANRNGLSLHVDQRGFVQTSAGYFFSNDGGVYLSRNGGQSFTFAGNELGTVEFHSGSAGGPGGNILVGGAQDNGILVTAGGQNWTQGLGGDGNDAIVGPQNANNLFADINGGDTHSSTNGGTSWTESSPQGLSTDHPSFLAPLLLKPGSSTTLYLGARHLWRSTDGAHSWQRQSGPAVFGGNPFQELAANMPGTLFGSDGTHSAVSSDGGSSWQSTSSLPCASCTVSDLAVDSNGTLYETAIGFTNGPRGHLFRSSDGGANWTEIDSGLPAVAFHAVTVDPNNSSIIYVGTDAGVFISRDQGGTWQQLGQGLPDAAVTHLDLAPDGSALTAFTLGRGAWSLATTPWQVVKSPDPGPNGRYVERILREVTAASANGVWAAGFSGSDAIITSWTGSSWKLDTLPHPSTYTLRAIDTDGSAVWAAGFGNDGAVALQLKNGAWQYMVIPAAPALTSLLDLSVASESDVWAVGYSPSTLPAVALHWNGSAWSSVPPPVPAGATGVQLNRIEVIPGTTRFIAVGYYVTSSSFYPYAVEWTGSAWQVMSTPTSPQGEFWGVVARSASNAWAVGDANPTATNPQSLIDHWNGKTWQQVSTPDRAGANYLLSVDARSNSDIWAVGYTAGSNGFDTLAQHWNGVGWSLAATPNPYQNPNPASTFDTFFGISYVPGTTTFWAVGTQGPARPAVSGENTLTERCTNC